MVIKGFEEDIKHKAFDEVVLMRFLTMEMD